MPLASFCSSARSSASFLRHWHEQRRHAPTRFRFRCMPLLRMTRDWLRGEQEEHFDSPGSTLTDVAAELAKHDRHPFVRVRIAIAAPHIQSKGAHTIMQSCTRPVRQCDHGASKLNDLAHAVAVWTYLSATAFSAAARPCSKSACFSLAAGFASPWSE